MDVKKRVEIQPSGCAQHAKAWTPTRRFKMDEHKFRAAKRGGADWRMTIYSETGRHEHNEIVMTNCRGSLVSTPPPALPPLSCSRLRSWRCHAAFVLWMDVPRRFPHFQ